MLSALQQHCWWSLLEEEQTSAGQPLFPQGSYKPLKKSHILIRTPVLLTWIENSLVPRSYCYHLWQHKGIRLTKHSCWLLLLPAVLFHTQQKSAVQKIGCPPPHDTRAGLFLPVIYAFGPSKTKDSSNVAFATPWASIQQFNRSHHYYIFTDVSPAFFSCQWLTCFSMPRF